MSRTKYLASYSGPSYGSMTQDVMDGFATLYEAMKSMRDRQQCESDTVRGYRLNDQTDVYQLEGENWLRFPATTREDVMDVYYCTWDNALEGYVLGDWAYRIWVGPKGGIHADKA